MENKNPTKGVNNNKNNKNKNGYAENIRKNH